jgi:hypothetical protein
MAEKRGNAVVPVRRARENIVTTIARLTAGGVLINYTIMQN